MALSSCNDAKLEMYKSIVQEADKFEICYKSTNKIITIPDQHIDKFKDILTRNVKPEALRKLIYDTRVNIFKNNNQIAFITIAFGNKNPFANFISDSLNFSFQLTYGIGMTLDNYSSLNSR